jgi:RNA polymerase sigma factor (sigma-70 family)
VEEQTDAELVTLARSGDRQAFDCLVRRYEGMAHRLARRMVLDPGIALELAQDGLLQAYLSLRHLRDPAHFGSWLYGIVLNVCRNHLRERKSDFYALEAFIGGLRCDASWLALASPDPQQLAEERELHRRVLQAVGALSPRDRAAALLFYYEGLSLREIAAILDVSIVAVKSRLHNARRRLREQLLPLYPERDRRVRPAGRRKEMVRVTVADVAEQEKGCFVALLNEPRDRYLPIWIGRPEATAIALGIRGDVPDWRPMTFTLMANMLAALDAQLVEVRLEALQENTYFAVMKLRVGETVREIDARPSDAIALALRTKSPIYVTEEVLAVAGQDWSAETDLNVRERPGWEAMFRELEEQRRAASTPKDPFQSPPDPSAAD